MKNYLLHILFLFCLNFGFSTQTQAQPAGDSILNQVFETPDLAIVSSFKIYNTPHSSTEEKMQALMLLTSSFSAKRDYQKSLEYALSLLDFIPKTKDSVLIINAYNQIATQYQELNIVDKATIYLEKALTLAKEKVKTDSYIHAELGYNYGIRGQIYSESLSSDLALTYFDRAIEEFKQLPENNTAKQSNLSIMYYNSGNCYIDLENVQAAQKSFENSKLHAENINSKPLISYAIKGLSKIQTLQGHFKEAVILLHQAETLAMDVSDYSLNEYIYKALSDNYLALKNLHQHQLYYNKALLTEQKFKTSRRNTINSSINTIIKNNEQEKTKLKEFYTPLQTSLIVLICISFLVLIRLISYSNTTLKNLRKHIKFGNS